MSGVEGLLVWVGLGVVALVFLCALDFLLGVFFDGDMRRRRKGGDGVE